MVTVTRIICLVMVLLSFSCGNLKKEVGPSIPWGRGISDETKEDFDMVEQLKENPLDVNEAGVEDFLSIPGFPSHLATRVIQVRGKRRSGTKWLYELTPPEREMLYAFSDYLILPDRTTLGISGRITADRLGSKGYERNDFFLSLQTEGRKGQVRSRSAPRRRATSMYLATRCFAGYLRVHGGDFLPTFGTGFLFAGYTSSYPFSRRYLFSGTRRVMGRTSFFGAAMRGIALEAWKGRVHTLLFTGYPRNYRDGSIELEKAQVRGARLEVRTGPGRFGASILRDCSSPTSECFSVDGRLGVGCAILFGEIVYNVTAGTGAFWGLSWKRNSLKLGFLMHYAPGGLVTRFGRIPGGSTLSQRGFTLILQNRIVTGSEIRAAFERSSQSLVFDLRQRETLRLEGLQRWRGWNVKVSYVSRRETRLVGLPFPGDAEPTVRKSMSANILIKRSPRRALSLRLSIRCPHGDTDAGYLISPSLWVSLLSGHVRAVTAYAIYRTMKGMQRFYYYEPSCEGSYPWRMVQGEGERGTLMVKVSLRGITFLCGFSAQSGKGVESCIQTLFDF